MLSSLWIWHHIWNLSLGNIFSYQPWLLPYSQLGQWEGRELEKILPATGPTAPWGVFPKRWVLARPSFSENASMAPCWIEVRCPRPLTIWSQPNFEAQSLPSLPTHLSKSVLWPVHCPAFGYTLPLAWSESHLSFVKSFLIHPIPPAKLWALTAAIHLSKTICCTGWLYGCLLRATVWTHLSHTPAN